MVKELGVAYYGNLFPDRARDDLKEMADHGCNSVLIAMSEYDWIEWKNNIFEICKIAKNEFNFTVHMNLWGWGRVFGGEAPSFFLNNNHNYRQVISTTGKKVPAACFNTQEFKKYIFSAVKIIAKKDFIDGFFWDEPHFHYTQPKSDYFTCRCEICQNLFTEIYKKEMPITKTDDIREFKENMIIKFLKELSQIVKEVDSTKKITLCLIPPPEESGINNWDKCCENLKDLIDVFSSDPYWLLYRKSLDHVEKYSKITVELAQKYKLESQLWCLAFLIPKNKESQLQDAINIFDKYEVDSIFSWCYRGAEGTSISCRNPKEVWHVIGEAYNNLKVKYNL